MPSFHHALLFAATLLAATPILPKPVEDTERSLAVQVRKSRGEVIVDVSMLVEASQRDAWDVLTDYDHMAEFFPRLTSSKVTQRNGNVLRLEQHGKVSYGLLSFPFESVREIELKPYEEIRSRAVGGSLRKGDADTRLVEEGGGTRIFYHSESVPAVWVPPGIGPAIIESGTRQQFESLRAEILKRKTAAQPAR
ncbi:SRPBCC family protein [Noviherbaspirillum massiliense]|uniref:SRPBCC family protein n=1 Tax=Noviherbaspirillum massiliense TaxID=1465823 RepID=UPI00030E0435|nr:SRPBCC family protein [Noviherbaspirillum massiliense]